jgi:hypothetical protein
VVNQTLVFQSKFCENSPALRIACKTLQATLTNLIFDYPFLGEKSHQFSFFNDEGNPAAIDEPVKISPLIHYLKIV